MQEAYLFNFERFIASCLSTLLIPLLCCAKLIGIFERVSCKNVIWLICFLAKVCSSHIFKSRKDHREGTKQTEKEIKGVSLCNASIAPCYSFSNNLFSMKIPRSLIILLMSILARTILLEQKNSRENFASCNCKTKIVLKIGSFKNSKTKRIFWTILFWDNVRKKTKGWTAPQTPKTLQYYLHSAGNLINNLNWKFHLDNTFSTHLKRMDLKGRKHLWKFIEY